MARIGSMARITPQVNEAEENKDRSSRGWPPGRRLSQRSQPKNPISNATPPTIIAKA